MKLVDNINPNIFREYDIRGIYEKDLFEDTAYTIGKSFGTYIKQNGETKTIIGMDNRKSSPILFNALKKGILETGIDVIDLGLVTTPMYYFGKIYVALKTGIMVTASHCTKEYNGFKIAFDNVSNAYGEKIQEFRKFTTELKFTEGTGKVIHKDIKEKYLYNFKKSIDLGKRKIKVIFDCGNGTGSIIIKEILDMFKIKYDLLYCTSDSDFPNHTPDPAVREYMQDLSKLVKKKGYDLGIGIDGDADRVGVVDEKGNYLPADLYLDMIYRNINLKNKKALFDVKCSRALIDDLNKMNIKPVMNRTGNSYCAMMMKKGDFDFGGEYSGHVFFRDKYVGIDDGIYAGMRLIEILSKNTKKTSDLLEGLNKYYSSDELKIEVTDDNKFSIVEGINKYAKSKKYKIIDLDGVRVEFDDGFALIRASNTGPNLTVRYEASTEERLKEITNEFTEILNKEIKKHETI